MKKWFFLVLMCCMRLNVCDVLFVSMIFVWYCLYCVMCVGFVVWNIMIFVLLLSCIVVYVMVVV